MTEWLDGPLGLWELCLCDEQTRMALLAVFARCLPPQPGVLTLKIATQASISQESLSLSQTKPAKDKGAVLVARRPLAFVSLDAPQGNAAWLAGRGGRWGNVRWTLLKRFLSHLSGIYIPFKAKGNCVSLHSQLIFPSCYNRSYLYSCLPLTSFFCPRGSIHEFLWVRCFSFSKSAFFVFPSWARQQVACSRVTLCACTVKAVK